MPHRLVNNQKRCFIRGICVQRSITFHKNDLNCVMSAFLIEQMISKDMINSSKNYKCLSLQYGMSNVTEAFFVDVSIVFSEQHVNTHTLTYMYKHTCFIT